LIDRYIKPYIEEEEGSACGSYIDDVIIAKYIDFIQIYKKD
jgi:hypothetical protein